MEPTNQEEKQSVVGLEGPQGKKKLSQVIQIDEGKIQAHMGEAAKLWIPLGAIKANCCSITALR